MGIVLCIRTSTETFVVDDNGQIGRIEPNSYKFRVVPSPSWRMIGAVQHSARGATLKFWEFEDVVTSYRDIQWTHKNGSAKTRIRDYDHGIIREWGSAVNVYKPNEGFAQALNEELERLRAFGRYA